MYLQKTSFGGLVVKQNYHYCLLNRPNYNPERIPELIEKAHERLRRVQIESLPYQDGLARYDRSATLFYLDPPYWGRQLYRFNFTQKDFAELQKRLKTLRGKFVLSLNDVPEVRKLFRTFRIRTLKTTYTAQRKAGNLYGELLIMNYK